MDSVSNEKYESSLFLALNYFKDKRTDKNCIVTVIYYEAVVTEINRNLFHQIIIYFVNKLESND